MRNLVFLLLGLVAGIFATTSVINTLRQRAAYPRGLMQVMQHHLAALRDDARLGRCTDVSTHALERLRQESGEIATAVYGAQTPDAPFREYDQRLRDALAATPVCTDLPGTLEKVNAACEACHRQYR